MYYLINKDTREIIRTSATPFNADETVQPPPPVIQLKRVVDETQPQYDANTHKLVRTFTDNDNAGTRTFVWNAVPLTQEELDAKAAAAAEATELTVLQTVYTALKNGTGTANERIQRLERAVAWLLREQVR